MTKANEKNDGLSDKHAIWLEDRRIPSELAGEIGLHSRGADLAFPYRTADGSLAFTKWRKPAKDFRIEPSGQVLLPWLLDRLNAALSDTLIWTEGEIDTLSFLAAGAQNVTSVPNGATGKPGEGEIVPRDDTGFLYMWKDGALRPELASFKRHILATDGDTPGQVLRNELAVRLGRKACWFVTYPAGCKDANDVLQKHGAEGVLRLLDDARPIVPDRLVRFSEIPRSSSVSLSSGWGSLDDHLMISLPELMVIGGPPNHGKSQFSLAMVANLARVHGMRAAIIQFEDSVDRHREDLERYAKAWQNGNGALIKTRPEQWIDDMFVTIAPPEAIDEAEEMTLAWLKERIHEAATRHGCKVVLIDPWNEIEHLWGGNESETAYTGKALRQIKALAKAYDLLVIVVTHPSKSGGMKADNEELTLYDLAGSAHWNNKPDHGIMIRRQRGTDETLVNIAKCRDFRKRGVPGQVIMRFDPRSASFNFVSKA
jgi:twinkle protein